MKKSFSKILIISLLLLFVFSSSLLALEYKEAPELAELVAAGELPPVEERLPEEPLIVGSGVLSEEKFLDWQPGNYGGTLQAAHSSPGWNPDFFVMNLEALLGVPGLNSSKVYGNIVKEYEVSEDNREFTFYLRKGLKWSDGYPVTTEDVRFTYEDVMMNDKLTPIFPAKYRAAGNPDGEPMDLEIVDDYTFKMKFVEPYGTFLIELAIAGWAGYPDVLKPAHYLKQFHIDYTPVEDMREDLKEEELEDEWWDLFSTKDVLHWDLTRRNAIGFPVLYPWHRVEGPSGVIVMERNPYYHKVDEQGRQLPYINQIKTFEVSDNEMVQMKIITGEVDYLRDGTSLSKMPLYKENAEKGGYRVELLKRHTVPTILFFNQTYDDPIYQEVVSDIRFRKAINYGMDRQEIIDSVYYGFASFPWLIPAEYDPDKAEQLLEEMGMVDRDDDGWREAPDGSKFEIFVSCSAWAPDVIPVTELLVEYMENLGIKANMDVSSNELRGQRAAANQLQTLMGRNAAPLWADSVFPNYLPGDWGWTVEWRNWYTSDGESGIEPPTYVKELYDIHEKRIKSRPDSIEYEEAINDIFNWYQVNIPYLPVTMEVMAPIIVDAKLKNVPNTGLVIAGNFAGEQWFFEE